MNSSDSPNPHEPALRDTELVVRRIVQWRLGSTACCQDKEDVASDVILELLERLETGRRAEAAAIADLTAYGVVAAHHGCDRYLRRRFPQRHRLHTRVRYLLEASPEYALWDDAGCPVAGYAKQRDQTVYSDLTPDWSHQVTPGPNPSEATAVAAILNFAGGPLRLPVLIDAVADLLNIRDQIYSTSDVDAVTSESDSHLRLSERQTLSCLWREIKSLPQPQRFALLMNLRDEEGGCALTGFPATGVASIRDIAAVIELPAAKLAEMWKDLPLSDLTIADMLGLSRQQVINLRKSARKRLARRMAGNIKPQNASEKVTTQSV